MDFMDTIREEGLKHKTVIITYVDAKGASSYREIEPYEIKGDGSLYGYCYARNSIRRFNPNGITEVEITNRDFAPRFEILL